MWYPKKTIQCGDNRFCAKQKQSVFSSVGWPIIECMGRMIDQSILSIHPNRPVPRENHLSGVCFSCISLVTLTDLSDSVSIDSVFKINLSFAESTTRLWQSLPFVSADGDFCPSCWPKKGGDLIAPHVACLCFYAVRYQRPCSQGWWFSVLYSVVGLLQWVES